MVSTAGVAPTSYGLQPFVTLRDFVELDASRGNRTPVKWLEATRFSIKLLMRTKGGNKRVLQF